MSEIQNTETPAIDAMPSHPVRTPGMDQRMYSKALHDYEGQLTKYFEANPSKGLARTETGATVSAAPAVAPNADDEALVKATQADAFKRFGAQGNPQVNAIVAKMYTDLYSGKRLDRDALAAAFGEAVATPESRREAAAIGELEKHVSEDGFVAHDKLPKEVLRGFTLPAGEYHAEQTVQLLKFAQENNVSQDIINAYIAMQEQQG